MEYRHVLDRIVKRKSACAFCMRCLLGLATGKRLGSMQRIPGAQFFLCALEDEEPIGFLAAEEHTDAACEIAVMAFCRNITAKALAAPY